MPTDAVAASRTYTFVAAIVPDVPIVIGAPLLPTLPEKSEVVETSSPAGGVTVIPAVMLAPEIEKLVATEGNPVAVSMAESVPVAVMSGLPAGDTMLPVEAVVMLTLVAPLLDNTMF